MSSTIEWWRATCNWQKITILSMLIILLSCIILITYLVESPAKGLPTADEARSETAKRRTIKDKTQMDDIIKKITVAIEKEQNRIKINTIISKRNNKILKDKGYKVEAYKHKDGGLTNISWKD